MNRRIEIVALTDRYGYDGETGIVVLKGTPGTVECLTLTPNQVRGKRPVPTLTVYWEAALVQSRDNKEPSMIEDWMESEVAPNEVRWDRWEPTTPSIADTSRETVAAPDHQE